MWVISIQIHTRLQNMGRQRTCFLILCVSLRLAPQEGLEETTVKSIDLQVNCVSFL